MKQNQKEYKKKYYIEHKQETIQRVKEWCENNRKRRREIANRWYRNNRDKFLYINLTNEQKNILSNRHKKWYSTNKDRLKETGYYKYTWEKGQVHYKRHLIRIKTDINYKIRCGLSTRLGQFFRGKVKRWSLSKYLGCNYNELRLYIEDKFKEGMNWDNYGRDGWNIDHIKPLCKFDLTQEDQFKEAVHYSNLQPLWASENYSKGGKFNLDYTSVS